MTKENSIQPLQSKKAILEAIALIKQEEKAGKDSALLEKDYLMLEEAIENMKVNVKPNTTAYLQNQLKNTLGKYEPARTIKHDYFIEFFKEAYPDGKRRKDYTWVLVDPTKITVDQIVHTLKYINAYCMKNRLPREVIDDIIPMMVKVARTDSLRHINQIRSMEGLRKATRVKIISTPRGHKVTALESKNKA